MIRTHLSALADRMTLQQAQNRMQGHIHVLEARAKKESRNRCNMPRPVLIKFETLD